MTFRQTAHKPLSYTADLQAQAAAATSDASNWIGQHWLQITIAAIAGGLLYAALNFLRGWGYRLCQRGAGAATWYSVLGRALSKTSQIFMMLVAARLVIAYSEAPPFLALTVGTLFTVSAVFQAAVWLREIAFGAIEHRTLDGEHRGQAFLSALGIIRLLVSIALFAIATVVVLSNLGVNVTGLVAGLGVGGIAIGLAAQGIFADLFAALAILFDRPFRIGDAISYDKGAGAGTVEAIGLKSTRVRGAGGEQRIIANKKLLDFEILNTTLRLHNRFKFEFFVGYATPPDVILRIPDVLKGAVESEGHRLIHGGLAGFATNGLRVGFETHADRANRRIMSMAAAA